MSNKSNCIKLGPTTIGSKSTNMGNDIFDKTTLSLKNTLEAEYLLNETENHLKNQYKEIFDVTMKELSSFPAHYEFGCETKKGDWARHRRRMMQYVDEPLVKRRIKQLAQKPNPSTEDIREKSHLELILKEKLPLSTEAKVIIRFQTFFARYRGLLLHSYKPESYLQRYIELAKDLRQTNNDPKKYDPPNLTMLEKDILNVLNISSAEVDKWVSISINKIQIEQSKIQGASQNFFSGTVIQEALKLNTKPKKDRKNQCNELRKTFSRFETQWDAKNKKMVQRMDVHGSPVECMFEKNDILCKLYKSEFKRLTTEFNDEFDCLLFLPDQQLIIGTEIKQAMKADAKANDKQTKEAAEQTKKRKAYIEKTLGNLLSQGWKYVEVIAMYDNNGSIVLNKCSDCSPYILTNGTPQEEEKQMHSLMTSLTQNAAASSTPIQKNSIAFDSFKHVFSRLIGLSGCLMAVQKLGPHHEIMGTDSKDLNAGWTRASPLKFQTENSLPRESDIFGRAHDVYKLIFYSPDQIGLLSMSAKFVVFLNDFGSGKSLLCKEGAIRLAKQPGQTRDVYYISLLAVDQYGKPKDEYFTFDEASKIDLKGTGVKVLDVHQLVISFKERHPEIDDEALKSVAVYELVEDLVDADPKASYFFDECPFIGSTVKWYDISDYFKYDALSIKKASAFIHNLHEKIDPSSQVYLAFQADPICDSTFAHRSLEKEFLTMKNNLRQNGIHIANLTANLRNTKDIGELSRNVKTFTALDANNTMTKHIQPLPVKSTDVKSSKPPLLIPMSRENRKHHLKQALEIALKRSKGSTKNVVITYDDRLLSSEDIKNILIECGEEEDNILLHPVKSKNESLQPLISYLTNPNGIYVVGHKKFVGMESNSVIHIINQREDKHDNDTMGIRCNISRAVAQLSIIMEINDDSFLREHKSRILFPSTEVDPTLVECRKTIGCNGFMCDTNFSTTSSSSFTSITQSAQLEHSQSRLSRFLSSFKKEKLICEACINVCHNNHEQRTFFAFGEGSFTSKLGSFQRAVGYLGRRIKCSIVGETKCSCNDLTRCQILKRDVNSFSTMDWFKSGLLGLFVFYFFCVSPIDGMISIMKDPFSTLNNLVLIPTASFLLYIFYHIVRA